MFNFGNLMSYSHYYRPRNIFTSVCQEFWTRGGGGVCLSACWEPPWKHPPPRQTPHPGQTPALGRPPPQQTATAAGSTHPTGMHYCPRKNLL